MYAINVTSSTESESTVTTENIYDLMVFCLIFIAIHSGCTVDEQEQLAHEATEGANKLDVIINA